MLTEDELYFVKNATTHDLVHELYLFAKNEYYKTPVDGFLELIRDEILLRDKINNIEYDETSV